MELPFTREQRATEILGRLASEHIALYNTLQLLEQRLAVRWRGAPAIRFSARTHARSLPLRPFTAPPTPPRPLYRTRAEGARPRLWPAHRH